MTVTIGHALRSMNDGTGDESGKEVLLAEWYSRPWTHVIRAKDNTMRNKIAKAMENACKNDNIGYDQNGRNTLLESVRKKSYNPTKAGKCDTDPSALVCVCCMYAGVDESALYINNNSSTTSNLRTRLMSTQMFECFTDYEYLRTPDNLMVGDILLSEGHHAAIVTGLSTLPKKKEAAAECYKKYTGESKSIIDALKSVGETDTSIDHRKQIAMANGVPIQTTNTMNAKLLSLLKEGTLQKA